MGCKSCLTFKTIVQLWVFDFLYLLFPKASLNLHYRYFLDCNE